MKYSQYNTKFNLSEKYSVLYNSYSDKYIVLGMKLEHIISSLQPDELLNKYEWLYKKFVEIGAIVKDSENETNRLKDVIDQFDNVSDKFHLIINPTLNCNFDCWYCYENHLTNSMMSEQTLCKVKKLITRILENQKDLTHFTLAFFGGEPLLGYRNVVKPLIEYCSTQCNLHKVSYNVNFTSNGYLLNDDMIRFFQDHQVDSFQITLDGCKEDHDKIRNVSGKLGSYDKILENVKKLILNDIQVILRINYTSKSIEKADQILFDIEDLPSSAKQKLNVNLQRVWQDSHENDIEAIVYRCLEKYQERNIRISKAAFSSARYSCYADKLNEALVNFNGDVFKCTARDFKEEKRMGVLSSEGKIIWKENVLKQWMESKFIKDSCKQCSIAPLCCGGCRQKAIETADIKECVMGYNEEQKAEIVKDRFYTQFVLKAN